VHGAQPIRILFSMLPFSLFLARRRGEEKHRETNPSPQYYFSFFQVGCTAMLYSTHGSVQPQEI